MGYGNTPNRDEIRVTITTGTALSAPVNLGGRRIVGIKMPAGWDAAGITFAALTRRDDSTNPPSDTYGKVQDAGGTEVAITSPALDTYVAIADTVALQGLGWVKVRSGTAAIPVNQTATRTLFLVVI